MIKPAVPVNTKLPTITGTAQQGEKLTEHNGEWTNSPTGFAYKWLQCNSSGTGCTTIAGATAQTYTPVVGDVGHTIRVEETASNSGGPGTPATSEPTTVVTGVPANTKLPSITGTPQQGKELAEVHGEWTNSPTGYTYKWQQCDSSGNNCTTIAGATTQAYTPVAGDVGHTLRVQETASNSGGPGTPATSEPTTVIKPAVPVITKLPTITGIAQQGEKLTEHNGEWTNSPTGFAYQWQQCNSSGTGCTTIAGATAQTYTPVVGDVGHTIRVQETASNEGGAGTPATSEPTSVVTGVPANTKLPSITGTSQQGKELTELHGEWTNSPTGYTYLWQQCDSSGNNCTTISGAVAQNYTPTAADVGHTIRVQETASNSGGPGTPATSTPTPVVLPEVPKDTTPPEVTGTAQQAKELTEVHGAWTNSPTGYTYLWQQCDSSGNNCTTISGAVAQNYTPAAADVGHTIRVQETASNSGGAGTPATSKATAVVLPEAPKNTKAPEISGAALANETLTEHNGEWTNSPTKYTLQWQRCDATGANCVSISGATAQTYTLGSADLGSTIRVTVTASNSGGSSAPASSLQTNVVVEGKTFGKTSVGAVTTEKLAADTKWVNRYALSGGGSISKLDVYLAPTATSGQQLLKGVIYADTGTAPGALQGVTEQLTFKSTSSTGWYDLHLASPLKLPAGNYWIGVISGATAGVAGYREDSVASSRDLNANTYTSGPSEPFGTPTTDAQQISLYATYAPNPPEKPKNTELPKITGTAAQGQVLTAQNGTWAGEPTSFTYVWQRCNASGGSCAAISGATAQTYTLAAADVGSTVRVEVTAANTAGSSAATSLQTAVVTKTAATFGKTTVGASSDTFASERKRVNRYALPTAGSVTKLTVYLAPTSTSGQEVLKGIIYADTGTAPGALLGVTEQLTFKSTEKEGWYELAFSAPVKLAAGNYWIGIMSGATASVAGFRWDSVTGSRDWNANAFASGPSNPFGSVTTDAEQTSLYATYE